MGQDGARVGAGGGAIGMAQLGLINKLEQGWVTSGHGDPRRGLRIKSGGGQCLKGHRDSVGQLSAKPG